MGLEYATDVLTRAMGTVAGEGPLADRLQTAWTDDVQRLWSGVHLPDELNDRFRAMWRRWTDTSGDGRGTTLRSLSPDDLARASGELVRLALDTVAADARDEGPGQQPG
jgi:hypothetical protein